MLGYVDQVDVDLVINGSGKPEGAMGEAIASGRYTLEPKVGFDPGILRPVIQNDGKKYCRIRTGRMTTNRKGSPQYVANAPEGAQIPESKHIPLDRLIRNGTVPPVFNSSALPYQTWVRIDRAVLKASRDRLNAWNDLEGANSYSGFDGMATYSLARDAMTDPGDAKVDMEVTTDDFSDAPMYTPDILPLPVIHSGANLTQRRLAASRNAGMPLDTTMVEACGRRCAETLEQMTIGVTDYSSLKTGQSAVPAFTNQGLYGFRTQPDRITKTDLTASGSFDAETFVNEVIAMIELARAQKYYGPFVLYYSTSWDQYLARDYYVMTTSGAAAPTQTVRDRVEQDPRISRVAMLDMFSNTDELVLVQMTSETVRAVNGMDFTTVQWQEQGGAHTRLRVMGIKAPDLRSQYVGTSTSTRKCGIVHGTTS